ncbi:MAG: DUF4832 domain-containing protein [Bacteroidales bacterium]|jgi:hypothetical protein|nr:DUF4832 domain-containing protein [Bacteroidales bacterium]
MTNNLIKTIFFFLILSFFTFSACDKDKENSTNNNNNNNEETEHLVTIEYQPNDSIFPNPERGFLGIYPMYRSCGTCNYYKFDVNEGWFANERKTNTLIHSMVYLWDYQNSLIPEEKLIEFDNNMAILRNTGLKVILRFAYFETSSTGSDASLELILQHLDQYKPFLIKNADVIAFMQAGFIGSCGEWSNFYPPTSNLGTNSSHTALLNKILGCLPANRMVQVRTPSQYSAYTNRSTPLNSEEAFNGSNAARIGYHNDCFLGNDSDCGTYQNPESEKAFLNENCLYVPAGGEAPGLAPPTGQVAYDEMRNLRYSYFGCSSTWLDAESINNINRDLGYRFQLISGSFTDEVSPGKQFSAEINLKNVGFANLYNERTVELVLKNIETNIIYKAKLNIDPRFWQPSLENVINFRAEVGISTNMPLGNYKLYLNLPDAATTLCNDPNYSIRLSNENVWEAATGYNHLGIIVKVQENSKSKTYTGQNFFKN